jgi:hypothetical protein
MIPAHYLMVLEVVLRVVIGVVFGVVVLLPPCSSMIEVDYALTSFKYAPIPLVIRFPPTPT